MRFLLFARNVCLSMLWTGQAGWADGLTPLQIGERIYRQGVLSSGQPLQARMQGDVDFSGAQVACINCHRRSGLGSVEGGRGVLPVTGSALFQPGPAGLWQKFNFKTQGNDFFRPAYDDASLSKAIRDGVTPTGRVMRAPMPKFELGQQDMSALIAYLKSLSNSPSPGVDETSLHLATVIAADADPAQRKAMLDVIEAFLNDKNTETRNESRRRQTAKDVMYTAYRKLDLQIWQLQGAPDTWDAQLQQYYQRQPVFAMVSGLAGERWQPVHDFCHRQAIACLFPNTDLPVVEAGDFYNVYFSRGVLLEADALGKYLIEQAPNARLVQVFREGGKGEAAAARLQQTLQAAGRQAAEQHKLAAGEKLDAGFWRGLTASQPAAELVLWLNADDLASMAAADLTGVRLYLSTALQGEQLPPNLKSLHDRVYLVSGVDAPAQRQDRVQRTKVWLQAKKIPISHEVLQANTFWTLMASSDAIKHLAGNFSSEYLLERTEDMTEGAGVLSIYPHLSLGPGQRFAAKSARLLKFAGDGSLMPIGDWINP